MRRDALSKTWAFYVTVTYESPDTKGMMGQWLAQEEIIGIGSERMSGDEARKIAERKLANDERTRQYILGKYPKGATATLGAGYLYEERLPDPLD
jgi:hypothetical protein